jgi:DME family drug/metabolite transporter
VTVFSAPFSFPLVAGAAALWGTDALFRRGLALALPAATVVLWEHLLLAVITLPWLLRVPWRRLGPTDYACLVVIGAGASAFATIMFTAAFRYGDPNTPLLLQKLQPFVAVLGARMLLGERFRPRFGVYFVAALTAGWLITFPDPMQVRAAHATAGALAAGAAALWALGTVLGRRMSGVIDFPQLAAARFAIGLAAVVGFAAVLPGDRSQLALGSQDILPLVLLALIPGLLAMLLYYRGLRHTPAAAATLAELAFPLTALTVNAAAFDATLTVTQAVGVAGLTGLLVLMSLQGQRQPAALGIRVPLTSTLKARGNDDDLWFAAMVGRGRQA